MDSKLFVCCYATFVPKIVNIIVLLLLFRFQPTSEKTFLVAVFFLPFFGFILYITGEFQSDIQLWERLHPFENLLCKRRVEMGFPSPNTKTKWKAANLPINSIFFYWIPSIWFSNMNGASNEYWWFRNTKCMRAVTEHFFPFMLRTLYSSILLHVEVECFPWGFKNARSFAKLFVYAKKKWNDDPSF